MEEQISADAFYKSFLENKDAFRNFSKFVDQAEDFNTKKSSYDVVKEYLNVSKNCEELLPYLKELHSLEWQNATLLLNTMCHILIRVASDLYSFVSAGVKIVNDILSYGMRTIFASLNAKQKSSKTKLALHVLSSMVALGPQTAAQVVTKLNFSHVNFTYLFYRSNCTTEEDVRTAFLNLIVLIMTICEDNVIRQLVEVKGFLNNVFPGLTSDRASTITLVLNTFRAKIIQNASIPKTSKIRLFNDYSLKPVIDLYTWKGPLKIRKYMKRKLGEEDKPVAYEVTEEEAREVHLSAHEFLLSLCCSYKYGIIFRDPSLGTSGRNLNHVITNVLKGTVKPYADDLTSEFVISVLKACPDQFKFYIPLLKDSFKPRPSELWVKAIEFFEKVMKSFDVTTHLFKSQCKMPASSLIDLAKMYYFPDLISSSIIKETLREGNPLYCYHICRYLTTIFEQVKTLLEFCSQNNQDLTYNATELSKFKQAFSSFLFQNLEISEELLIFWNKVTSGITYSLEDVLKDLTVPTFSQQMLSVLKVIKLFQEICQHFNQYSFFNFLEMLGTLQKCTEYLSKKELSQVRIELLDLLTTEEPGTLLFGEESTNNTPFLVTLDMYLTDVEDDEKLAAVQVINKVLLHTKLFDNCQIDSWLNAIKSAKTKHLPSIFEFFSQSLNASLSQSSQNLYDSFKVEKEASGDLSESANALKVLNDIMDNEDDPDVNEENQNIQSSWQCFSSLVPNSQQQLKYCDEQKKKDSFWLLLQHRSDKDLETLCELIEHNAEHRQLTQNYLIENIEDSLSIDDFFLASRCINACDSNNESDQNFKNSIAIPFWKAFKPFLSEGHKNKAEFLKNCQVGSAILILLKEKIISPKKLSKFCNSLLQNPDNDAPSSSKMTVLLQLLEVWKNQRIEQDKELLPFLQIIFKWMACVLSKKFEHWDLISYIKNTLKNLDKIDITEVIEVNVFFQKALKISMAYEDVGKVIMEVLILLCEKSKGVNLPVQDIFNLTVGHSNFFQVMLSQKKEDNKLKENLIDLITVFTKLDSTICKEQHITLFLGAYSGTLSSIDQKLLYLIKIYSNNDINMAKYAPFLWGQAAITHYSIVSKGMENSLMKPAKLRDIVSLLSPAKMESTILHYPLKIALQPSLDHLEEVDEKLADKIYDLRFFLPLLANLLSPGAFLNFNCFIESRLLMLIFISLSSFDSNVRAMGYYCLSQLYYHLESSNSKEKEIWLSLLDSVRNSIASSNSKLSCIITLFLARVTDIFTKPNNPMYAILYKYIMVKPCLDITQVPEFYKLFNSLDLKFRVQRLWLFKLLAEGLRTSLDFHVCEKRYVFSLIQSHYWSSVSTQQEKVAILNIVLSAVKIKSSAKTLCQNGLLVWLNYIVKECNVDNEISIIVNKIEKQLSNMNIDNSSSQFLESLKKNMVDNSLNGQFHSSGMEDVYM